MVRSENLNVARSPNASRSVLLSLFMQRLLSMESYQKFYYEWLCWICWDLTVHFISIGKRNAGIFSPPFLGSVGTFNLVCEPTEFRQPWLPLVQTYLCKNLKHLNTSRKVVRRRLMKLFVLEMKMVQPLEFLRSVRR